MIFNSFEFLLFLPVVFCLYWAIPRGRLSIQNIIILLSSYFFYGWMDWRMLGLIFITSLSSFLAGIYMDKSGDNARVRKLINASNIVLNIGILCAFKYFNFFAENFVHLFSIFGMQMDWVTLKILLPIGISFYTFTALSYSIDVYMKRIKAVYDPVVLFSYISFFPHIMAGPIARATQLVPQFQRPRKFDYAQSVDGLRQILWGLFKKLVIADNMAREVSAIFDTYQTQSGGMLLVGAFYFTIQIYCDFSGYSDMAIGVAKLFGINLLQNFKVPYFSRNVAEFWRRWHISLNTWFRDYIYIPLGGSRDGNLATIRNTMIIFLVCGLWHGANWTFILWGAYHGALFIPLVLSGKNKLYKDTAAMNSLFPSVKELLNIAFTFILVMLGWIIFRADNISQAFWYISGIITHNFFPLVLSKRLLLYVIIMFTLEWINRRRDFGLQFSSAFVNKHVAVRWIIYIAILFFTWKYMALSQNYIYFKF